MAKRYLAYTDVSRTAADLETRIWARNSKVEGAVGDSVADDRAALNTLVNVTMQPGGGRVDVLGVPRVASNLTIPRNVTLNFVEGAYLAPDVGVTVTINSPIRASLVKIFGGGGSFAFGFGVVKRIYPQWWGAFGDDVNDDTIPINSCLGSANSGMNVHFVEGSYKVSGTLNQTIAAVKITGDGVASIIRPTTAAFNVFTLGAAAHRTKFRELWIKGAATSNATTQFGIFTNAFAAPDDVDIRQMYFGATSAAGASLNSGVKADGGNRWKVQDSWFTWFWGAISNTGYGVLGGATNALDASRNHFVGGVGRGRHCVYLSGGCTYGNVHNNYAEGFSEEAFPIYSQGAQPTSIGNRVHHNTINGGGQLTATGAAISIFGKATRNVISNNMVYGYQGSGITVNNSTQGVGLTDGNVLKNNDIRNVSWHGIHIVGASNTKVRGNDIYDIGQASAGTYVPINCQADGAVVTDKTTIVGNDTRGAATHRAGLQLEAGTTGTIAHGNTFPDGLVSRMILNACPLKGGRRNEVNLGAISGNNGDASVTIQVSRDAEIEMFASALTVNRTVTLDATNAYEGAHFRVVRTGLGAFTLDVGGLRVIPAATAAWVDVEYDGAAWKLVGYGTL